MKILHVIPSISPQRGGPSQAVIQMVKALRERGMDARIVTTQDNGIYRQNNLPIGEWFQYADVPVIIHSCIGSELRFIREYLISVSLTDWLIRHMGEYDLIHIHAVFSYPSTVAMLIARLKRIPYIVRTIGQLSQWSMKQGRFRKLLMLAIIERKNLNSSLFVHVTSKSEEDDIEYLGIKARRLLLGLGVDLPEPGLVKQLRRYNDSKHVRFLYLSRLHPKKQIEILLEGFHIIKEKYKRSDWILGIAGSGEEKYLRHLQTVAQELNISEHLEWHGHVSGENKQRLMAISDWFVLTSASENFGISAVEAMAFYVPVILTRDVGVSDKVIDFDAGLICEQDLENIGLKLKEALETSGQCKRRAARQLVEANFNWAEIAEKLSVVYKSCTKRGLQ